jgi:hypothetical protein
MDESPLGSRAAAAPRALFWSIVAVLPFLAFPAAHDAVLGSEATGLTTYDLPYYAANARAILDRGHWGAGPNAFDSDPDSPVIYFHWLIDVVALLIGPLGLGPGTAMLLIQIVGGWAAARLLFAVVETVWLPRPRLVLAYLSTVWGGGLLLLGKLVANVSSGSSWSESLLAFDPGQGLWGLNFGRNLILPTEAVYHALMMALWLGIVRERWTLAASMLWLIATTHPFTAAQALAIVGAWIVVRALSRRPVPRGFLLNVVAVSAAFGAYYFVYLPSFPAHNELQETWTLGWTLTPLMMLLAYSPALALAATALSRDPEWRRRCAFFATAAVVSFLLANHHWFMTPRQPIHFTRGYIWTPLWIMGLPTLTRMMDFLRASSGWRVAGRILLASLVVSDNAIFLATCSQRVRATGFSLSSAEREAFAKLAAISDRGVLLTDDERMGYLAAAYAPVRPYFGHKYNTPRFEERRDRMARFQSGEEDPELLNAAEFFLTRSPSVASRLERDRWRRIGTFADLQLWRKP